MLTFSRFTIKSSNHLFNNSQGYQIFLFCFTTQGISLYEDEVVSILR